MKNKITKITKVMPQEVTLPDGLYTGRWVGKIITITYFAEDYKLSTENMSNNPSAKVVVEIKDGVATFDLLNS